MGNMEADNMQQGAPLQFHDVYTTRAVIDEAGEDTMWRSAVLPDDTT
jgi:hypothetical protein